ncbi:MAG: sialidase family protein [Candidatus Latescibacterota bacterium]|jgi:hypothetical protein
MKITSIAPLSYTPGKLEYHQFIRGGIGADYHQGPSFYQFADGEVMVTWGAYDYDECSPNCVTLYSRSPDRGIHWSDPQVYMVDYPAGPLGGTLLRLRDGRSTLMIVQQARHEIEVDPERRVAIAGANYFRTRTHAVLRRSEDGGLTFDHGHELAHQGFSRGLSLPGGGWYGSIDSLLQLQDGRIVAAFMYLDPERSDLARQDWGSQHYTVGCLLSDDEGRTWRPGGQITVDTPRGAMEAQVVEPEPGRLFCLFRTKGGCLYQTSSIDGGQTWTASAPSPLTAPESLARLVKLHSGRLLVVWNSVSSVTQQPRHPLAAAVSSDGGHTWGQPRVIADETGTNQLSNHGLIQLDDGRLLLGISHYRDVRPMTSDLDLAIFDEAWLAAD